MKKLYSFILFTAFFLGFYSVSLGQTTIYLHNFGTETISTHPYTVAPITFAANLSSSSWSNSNSVWTSFAGSSGQAISLNNSSGTPTITLTFNIAEGYKVSINQFNFWRQRSTTGAQNWSMTINGISVGSGSVPTTGEAIGATNVSNAVDDKTTSITVILSLSGASGTGTFRLDDFQLIGTVVVDGNTPPTITSPVVSSITPSSANLSANITSDGGDPVTARGFVYSLTSVNSDPLIGGTGVTDVPTGSGTGSFNETVSSLASGSEYTFKGYATNGEGTSYTNATNFFTFSDEPTVQSSAINFTTVTTTGFTINWTNGNGANRVVFLKEGTGAITNPVDGTTYTASSNWSSKGTQLGSSGYFNVFNGSGENVTITNLAVNTQYTVYIFEYNGSSSTINYLITSAPTSSKYTLANIPGEPTVASPTVSTLNVTINANSNPSSTEFAIYESVNEKYVQSDGSLDASEVWATIATWGTKTVTGLTAATLHTFQVKARNGENVETNLSTGTNGTTYSTEPTVQASSVQFSSIGQTSMTISWTNGNGSNRIVLVKSGSAVNSNPVDGTSYTANTAFGSGSQLGTGNYVVYNSSSNSVTVTNLTASTTYHIAVYEFNGSSGTQNYLTTLPLTGNQTTEAPPAGLQISALDTEYLIDFDNTVSGVNNGQFEGSGFSPSPTSGMLNSNSWAVTGWSDGDLSFGGTRTTASTDYTRGTSNGGITTGGIYAFTVSSGNRAFGFQPGASDWAPGTVTLKVQNQTGLSITSLLIKYVIYVRNDQGRSNSFNFSYSSNNSTYTNVNALDLVSAEAADGTPTWKANIRTYLITDISISDNDFYYLRWSGADVGGSGSRDEFALDDIVVVGNPSNTSPAISGTIESAVISGNTQINSTTTVNGTLTFSGNSKLLLGNNNLIIGSSGSISGANSTNYVVTNGTGNLQQNITNGNSKTFHVGPSTSNYNPVTIQLTAGSTTDNYLVRAKSSFTNTPLDVNKVVNVAWEITEQTGGGTDATITLQWNQSQEGSEFNRATGLHIGRFNGDSWVGSSATLGGDNPFTASAAGFTSFSEFGVGSEGALPVELTSFLGKSDRSNIILNWSTATEVMNYGFEVQRKVVSSQLTVDNEVWEKVVFVEGHGNSNSVKEYSYTDKNLSTGKYLYRLKQIDTDGSFSFSDVIEVEIEIPKEFALIQNYPNPFNPSTVISYQLAVDSKVSLKIYDILGTEVAELVNTEQTAGSYEIVFDASQLSTGVYFYTIQAGDFSSVKKMILMK